MIIKFKRRGERREECADAVFGGCRGAYSVISLADGVSMCRHAAEGADAACRAATELLLKHGGYFISSPEKRAASEALSHVLGRLRERAESAGADVSDYSSTLSCVLIDRKRKRLLCLSLGDSVVIACGRGKCRVLLSPAAHSENGEICATGTTGAENALCVKSLDASDVDSVTICSDGAWRHMFESGRIRETVRELLLSGDCAGLGDCLAAETPEDDCSFITVRLGKENIESHGRKTA